jgi:hypothetical protein
MQPGSPQAVHFLGLQRVSIVAPHFSQVNTAILYSSKELICLLLAQARRPCHSFNMHKGKRGQGLKAGTEARPTDLLLKPRY